MEKDEGDLGGRMRLGTDRRAHHPVLTEVKSKLRPSGDRLGEIWVLVYNVGIPTFVSLLSIVHILSYLSPTLVSLMSLFCPLSHFCLVCVFKFSVLS